jgi:hypothetical protein
MASNSVPMALRKADATRFAIAAGGFLILLVGGYVIARTYGLTDLQQHLIRVSVTISAAALIGMVPLISKNLMMLTAGTSTAKAIFVSIALAGAAGAYTIMPATPTAVGCPMDKEIRILPPLEKDVVASRFLVSGTATPSRTCTTVNVYVQDPGHHWWVVDTVQTDSSGNWTAAVYVNGQGQFRIRAYLSDKGDQLGGPPQLFPPSGVPSADIILERGPS